VRIRSFRSKEDKPEGAIGSARIGGEREDGRSGASDENARWAGVSWRREDGGLTGAGGVLPGHGGGGRGPAEAGRIARSGGWRHHLPVGYGQVAVGQTAIEKLTLNPQGGKESGRVLTTAGSAEFTIPDHGSRARGGAGH